MSAPQRPDDISPANWESAEWLQYKVLEQRRYIDLLVLAGKRAMEQDRQASPRYPIDPVHKLEVDADGKIPLPSRFACGAVDLGAPAIGEWSQPQERGEARVVTCLGCLATKPPEEKPLPPQ
jgi:hypothetical protein